MSEVQVNWPIECYGKYMLTLGIATISIAYGVVADIATPAERGSFVGAVLCG